MITAYTYSMSCVGIGKTTLAHEICVKWARDGFLSNYFDIIIMVALRKVRGGSLEEAIIKEIGEDAYKELDCKFGFKSLIILEGLDEMAAEQKQNDSFFQNLISCYKFERAVILITSRPNACQDLPVNRKIEIIGFGEEQIKEFVMQSFSGDSASESADKFLQHLKEYPHIYSLCYVPISLVMIIDIYKERRQSFPSTLVELYQNFIVMMLKREKKRINLRSSTVTTTTGDVKHTSTVTTTTGVVEQIIFKIFPRTTADSAELIETLFLLSKLAYLSFFERNPDSTGRHDGWRKASNPKIIFGEDDLAQCNIKITDNFDGDGLLKAELLHHEDSITYNFTHLTVQEFLCAVYMLTLTQKEQYHLLKEYFELYPNIMTYYCGLTRLDFFQVVYSKLPSPSTMTAVKCLHEAQQNTIPHQSTLISPFALDMALTNLTSYDLLSLSYVCFHYPVSQLKLSLCYIRDKTVEILAKWCLNDSKTSELEKLNFYGNHLTCKGMKHVMTIARSEPHITCKTYLHMTML